MVQAVLEVQEDPVIKAVLEVQEDPVVQAGYYHDLDHDLHGHHLQGLVKLCVLYVIEDLENL